MFKPHFKKTLAAILAATNLAYPLIAVAETYGYRAAVRDLTVVDSNSSGGSGGSVSPSAILEATPGSQSFGSVIVGQTSEPRTVTFLNTGTLPAQTGTAYASTDYILSNECNSVVLAPAQACTVQVRFAPGSVKNFAPGSVTVPYSFSGSTGTPTAMANFTAIGAPVPVVYAPVLSLDVSNLNFGSVEIGSSLTRHAVLSNTGNLDANLSVSNLPAGMEVSGTCSAVLAAGQSCDLDVTFTPTDTSFKAGLLLVSANGSASYASLSLGGQGTDTFKFETSSDTVSFAPLEAGAKTVTVLNTGSAPLTHPLVTSTGPYFTATHNCETIAPGASCEVSVTRFIDTPGFITSVLYISFDNAQGQSIAMDSTLNGSAFTIMSPTEQSFGDVTVGDVSGPLTYTVLNTGNLAANVLVSAPTQEGVSQGGTCGGTLAAGAQCEVTLSFAPTAHNAVSGVVTVQDISTNRDFQGSALLTYSGQGLGFPVLQASVEGGTVFGPALVGTPVTKTLTVTNNGTFEATGIAIAKSGAAEFVLSSHCQATLSAGASCAVDVTFTPSAIAPANATLSITSSNAPPISLGLQGGGQAAVLAMDAYLHLFGNVDIGSTVSESVTLTNTGNIPASLISSSISAPFTRTGTCSEVLAAGASCTIVLTYSPTTSDLSVGMLTVSSAGTSASISFSGTGRANPSFSMSSSVVDFGGVLVGSSTTQMLTVTNTGNVALTTPYMNTSGAGFTATHTCGTSLEVGASCMVEVSLAPTSPYSFNGELFFGFSTGMPQLVQLTGMGQAVLLSLNTFTQSFGGVNIGSSSTVNFTITNSGNLAGAFSTTGVSAPFALSGTCGESLAPADSCTLAITFTPADDSSFNRSLTVNVGNKSLTLNYTGHGIAYPALTLSAYSVPMGNVAKGSTTTSSVVLYNSGNVPLSTPSLTSTGAAFGVSHNCPSTLAVGATCQATVTFAPTAPQSYSGSLYVSYALAGTQLVMLSGTGQAAVLNSTLTAKAFGNVAIGSTASATSSIVNTGNIAASLSITPVSAPFSRSGSCATSLAAGASCTIVIAYSPTSTATSTGAVTVSAVDTSVTVDFSGTGQANPSIALSTSAVNLGNVAKGSSTNTSVAVTNNGNVPLSTPVIEVAGAAYSATHNCPETIAAGSSCQVTVTFAPVAHGSFSGSVSIGYSGVTSQVVAFNGVGQAALLSTDVNNLAFGNIAIGGSSARTFTLSNTGNLAAALSVSSLAAPYSLNSSCGATLAAGANCVLAVTFAPTSGVVSNADLTMSAANTSTVVSLSGTGQANPSFSLSSNSVSFGNVASGSTNAQAVTVSNTGNVPLTTPSILTTGTNVTVAHNCPATLATGATCTATLTFAPNGVQTLSGTLSVNFAGLTARTASLSGTGQAAVLTASSATLSFGSVSTGTSATQTVTVTNSGNLVASLGVGTPAAPFTRGGTCTTSSAAGASCTVTITYAPTAVAPNSGSITVSAGSSTVTINYSGSGKANYALLAPYYNLYYEGQHSAWYYTGHPWTWAYPGYVNAVPPGTFNFQTLLVNNSGTTRTAILYVSADNTWVGTTLNGSNVALPGCYNVGFGGVCSQAIQIPDGTSRLTMSIWNAGSESNPAGFSAWVVDTTSGAVLADTNLGGSASRWYWY